MDSIAPAGGSAGFTLPSASDLGHAIQLRLDELARFSDDPEKITRLYLSPAHRQAADCVAGWMQSAGMSTRLDPLATLIGTYSAKDEGAPHLLIGSHIDSVRDAGKFDGSLGVILAIELVKRLHAAGVRLPFGLTILAFGDEEGVRFSSTLSGSLAVAGRFDPKILDEVDEDGISRRAALATFGCPPGDPTAGWHGQTALGYLETHIEQGPVLEAENRPLGLVTAIAGATRGVCRVSGQAGHAGTVPMVLRKDALTAAAEMLLAVERIARSTLGLVGTVGRLHIPSSAVNTIPGTVEFSLDIRSESDSVRKAAAEEITAALTAIASSRAVKADVVFNYDAPAAECDPLLRAVLAEAAEATLQKPVRLLASGAGHDAMVFRNRMPFSMMFVRSRAGVSHHPDEFSSEADIGLAALTMFRAVLLLARRHGATEV
ncbi:ArgE Acetylornithine deacetylase/Succinyl-diaminopimelate desuccinylase and related deacylases [Rhabdaerophilaceae bacterium]